MKFFRFTPVWLLSLALLCFGAAYLSNQYSQNPEVVLQASATRLQELLMEAELTGERESTDVLQRLATGQVSFHSLTSHTTYPTFIFRGEQLVYWSDHSVRPDPDQALQRYHERLLETRNGKFLVLRHTEGAYVVLTYIPLEISYGISNRYLRNGNGQGIFQGQNVRLVVEKRTSSRPRLVSNEGNYLFSIESLQADPITGKYLPLLLLLLGFALYVAGWGVIAHRWFARGKVLTGAAAVVLPLAVFRAGMLYLGLPFSFLEVQLFDPRVYAASWVSPSLGDLLLNAGLFVITAYYLLLLFRRYGVLRFVHQVRRVPQRVAVGSITVLAFYGLLELLFDFYSSSFSNSQLILDITQDIQANFFKLLLLLAIVLHTGGYLVGFYLLSQVFNGIVRPSTRNAGIILLLLSAVAFLVTGIGFGQVHATLLGIALLFFLVLRLTGLKSTGAILPYQVYLFIFLMLGVSSAVGALALYEHFNRQLQLNKQNLASNLLTDNDLQGEYLLVERGQEMTQDPVLRTMLASPFVNLDLIRQKVVKYYLRDYFNKYEVRVILFNPEGKGVAVGGTLEQTRSFLLQNATRTDHPNIYLIRDSNNSFSSRRYVAFVSVPTPTTELDGSTSTVVLELSLKKLTANSVVPELLVDQKFFQPQLGTELSYGGYQKGQLVYSEGDFDYVNQLPPALFRDARLYTTGVALNGYHHLAIRATDHSGRMVLVTTATYSFSDWLANFSFLFLLHGFCCLLLMGAFLLARGQYRELLRTNFSTKIQLFLNFGILVPLIVVSVAIASQVTTSYKHDLLRSYQRRGQAVQENLLKNRNLLTEAGNRADLVDLAENVAALTETDLNLYDAQGQLLVSSQPLIFEANLLSTLMNPQAVAALTENGQPRVLLTERAGTLSFNALYLPLRAGALQSGRPGAVLGYVGIPFFDSEKDLDIKLTELVSTILNIFTVMFILFLVLAFLASRILTEPLKLITEKLKQTTLTGQNEMLAYESEDEIGLLVREYNQMLLKLEESKQELAAQEKEAAWREMARQVAHEIKNPLTPMKLSLQFLQRAIQDKRPNLDELMSKVSQTLITQIDVLTDIATSFSNFTNLPAMRPERLDVAPVLRRCVGLHQGSTGGTGIRLVLPEDAETGRYVVFADESLLVRTFNNLLINALQAIPPGRAPEVEARLEAQPNNRLRICIQDNGTGIPAEVREKVFVPNFTTKEKGSGIGLAVARRGIESAGGSIWFETEEGKGTSFCIDLPLAG
ncbi:HAMP domain-containing histidine kinase [Hymenobacter sp. HSC-4F20]|uniref:sensor histidine kinase n=1 Tax=Hymenobacter sp. HSC-4F20 TaxID=2864135 RepID=UPI001C73C683|nr:HAMP domain-containing sensor histidine kinase [Hymenobacter sp. HSC-4F20]MBX0290750.1 HAMP domain-containing histidine kinase [Hymenobacter sp. HSC-4F20]